MKRLVGILLAAGESSRMGFPKPLLRIGAETFIEHSARTMLTVVPRLVIVIGAHAEKVRPAIPKDERIAIVENPEYERGQLSSLKAAIRAMPPDCDAALVHLGDHPTVKPSTFQALADGYRSGSSAIAIARCGGRRGHPTVFDRSVFDELLAAPDGQGARVVVNAEPGRVVYVDIDDPGILLDLDTPADLVRAGLPPVPK